MNDNDKLERSRSLYKALREKALTAMTGDHPNAIWNQMARMINDEMWFKVVIRIRDCVDQPPINPHLWNTFITGYAVTQSLAIRRLTDRNDSAASLLAIANKIKNNASLLTREVVVGFDGTPMDAEALYQEMANSVTYKEGTSIGSGSRIAAQKYFFTDMAHKAFDRLCDGDMSAPRAPTDRISATVLDRLHNALNSDAIKRVRYQCDKYLAHADLADLSNGLASPTYNDIHDSIKKLVMIKQFLCADFFNHSGSSVVATYQGDPFRDLSVPLVPSMPVETYREVWREVESELEWAGNAEQFRQFAIHP